MANDLTIRVLETLISFKSLVHLDQFPSPPCMSYHVSHIFQCGEARTLCARLEASPNTL